MHKQLFFSIVFATLFAQVICGSTRLSDMVREEFRVMKDAICILKRIVQRKSVEPEENQQLKKGIRNIVISLGVVMGSTFFCCHMLSGRLLPYDEQLQKALSAHQLDTVTLLLKKGASLPNNKNIIHEIITLNSPYNIQKLLQLLKEVPTLVQFVNQPNDRGIPPLFVMFEKIMLTPAFVDTLLNGMELLVDAGANINAIGPMPGEQKNTKGSLLHATIYMPYENKYGKKVQEKITNRLLAWNINRSLVNSYGLTYDQELEKQQKKEALLFQKQTQVTMDDCNWSVNPLF